MALVSKVLRSADLGAGKTGFAYWCPACECAHVLCTAGGLPQWSFDGNVDQPTFAPSVKVTTPAQAADDDFPATPQEICHHFVEAGIIKFCSDSTHKLAGQNVEMSPIVLDGGAA